MKLWGGRFQKETDKSVNDFHSSIRFDSRMYRQDIMGSIAHASMLGRQGIIPQEDSDLIVKTLQEILSDIEAGNIEFEIDAEDIHMNVEKILSERIGDAGKRLHTGRSRNDQVALDLRMYVMDELKAILGLVKDAQQTILNIAKDNLDTIMPGYTHLQKAQPITLAHHVMAYFEMLKRDALRLLDCLKRTNVMPLGSGALAATTYPLDREYVAQQLGFDAITLNSLDGVSDRDFAIEAASALSILMMHLSRFCEELILWNSNEFSFVEMDDAYSTGSSIMPQKKNPDVAELIRGKTGRVYGGLMTLLTMMKGIPLAYNKDMQEDKESIFDAFDTLNMCLDVFTPMLRTMRVKKDNMMRAAQEGFINATDLADYLVKKGMPFRTAYKIVGRLVAKCIQDGTVLETVPLEEYKEISPLFEADVYDEINLVTCVEKRTSYGGTGRASVLEQIAYIRGRAQ